MYAYLCIYIIRCIMFFRWIVASMISCDILKCSSLLLPPLSHFPDHITCTLLFSLLLTTPPVLAKDPYFFSFLCFAVTADYMKYKQTLQNFNVWVSWEIILASFVFLIEFKQIRQLQLFIAIYNTTDHSKCFLRWKR